MVGPVLGSALDSIDERFEQLSMKLYKAIIDVMPIEDARRMEVIEAQFITQKGRMLCGRHAWWICMSKWKLEPHDIATAEIIDPPILWIDLNLGNLGFLP